MHGRHGRTSGNPLLEALRASRAIYRIGGMRHNSSLVFLTAGGFWLPKPTRPRVRSIAQSAPVSILSRRSPQPDAHGVGHGALWAEAHDIAPVEEAEWRPAALALCASKAALEVACYPRPLLHGDGGGGGQGTEARISVYPGVTEHVDLGVIGQGKVFAHMRAARRVVLPRQAPHQG